MADARSWYEEEAVATQAQTAFERRVPRHEEGGASAPLSPPNGYGNHFDKGESVFTETSTPPTAADICTEAARLVGGNRAATHGDKAANFQIIAHIWNGYMRAKYVSSEKGAYGAIQDGLFDACDVGNLMELMKVARRLLGAFNIDDYVDGAGYAACTGEIAAGKANAKP